MKICLHILKFILIVFSVLGVTTFSYSRDVGMKETSVAYGVSSSKFARTIFGIRWY